MNGEFLLLALSQLGNTAQVHDFHLSLDSVLVHIKYFLSGDDEHSLLSPLVLVYFLDLVAEQHRLWIP